MLWREWTIYSGLDLFFCRSVWLDCKPMMVSFAVFLAMFSCFVREQKQVTSILKKTDFWIINFQCLDWSRAFFLCFLLLERVQERDALGTRCWACTILYLVFAFLLFYLYSSTSVFLVSQIVWRFDLDWTWTHPPTRLRFMIYIAIGHAFDAVEGSLLENYGLDTQDGTTHCHAVFMEHASMVGETAYLVTYEKWKTRTWYYKQRAFYTWHRIWNNDQQLLLQFQIALPMHALESFQQRTIFFRVKHDGFQASQTWIPQHHGSAAGYNASLTSWTALACAITSILSLLGLNSLHLLLHVPGWWSRP